MPADAHELLHTLLHTAEDLLPVIPFLYLCYLFLEFLERRVVNGAVAAERLRNTRLGPLAGGLLGVLPQCGFSAAAAGLYAGRIVSLGTLLAVFLSTSDEMLPVLLAGGADPLFVFLTVFLKACVAILCGFLIDLLIRRRHTAEGASSFDAAALCQHSGCHCESRSIFLAAVYHALRVFLFLFLVSLGLNLFILFVGEDRLGALLPDIPVLGNLIAALVGLIPNCAASVVLTELYLRSAISYGALFSGLLPGAGIGLLVLLRVNRHPKENLLILLLLVGIGTAVGVLFDSIGVEAWLRAPGGGL